MKHATSFGLFILGMAILFIMLYLSLVRPFVVFVVLIALLAFAIAVWVSQPRIPGFITESIRTESDDYATVEDTWGRYPIHGTYREVPFTFSVLKAPRRAQLVVHAKPPTKFSHAPVTVKSRKYVSKARARTIAFVRAGEPAPGDLTELLAAIHERIADGVERFN